MDIDAFVAACRDALDADQPMLAVKEVVEAAVAELHGAAPLAAPGVELLHRADDLTVAHVMVPPGAPGTLPHDHRMWAVVGVYGGQEDNTFYRRDGSQLEGSGGRQLHTGDVLVMGDATIHSIRNPRQHDGLLALHVYGGDLVGVARSMWVDGDEQPYQDTVVFGGSGIR